MVDDPEKLEQEKQKAKQKECFTEVVRRIERDEEMKDGAAEEPPTEVMALIDRNEKMEKRAKQRFELEKPACHNRPETGIAQEVGGPAGARCAAG